MSVFRRQTSKGLTGEYHYRFFKLGKIYSGVCNECTKKEDAEKFEEAELEKIDESLKYATRVKRAKKISAKVRETILGSDTFKKIPLQKAYDVSLEKPKRRKAGEKFSGQKRSYWKDFVAFLSSEYPELSSISDVEKRHAEAYLTYLRKEGRYNKEVTWVGGKAYSLKGNLSNKTCNVIHTSLKEIFSLLREDAGLDENPFDGIQKLDNNSETREAFTEDELKEIFKKADNFIKPIFAIGICTALREGDIALLRWEEVDFGNRCIRLKMKKTEKLVEVPMLPELFSYLMEIKGKTKSKNPYVLPVHAAMYKKNPDGISTRVKAFLDSLKIVNTKKIEGRTRQVSIKDVHSLRHTFCYLAGIHGIPLLIVQSVCGHMTPEMTSLYQRHADLKAKQVALEKMPGFLSLPEDTKRAAKDKAIKKALHEIEALLQKASEKQIRNILISARKICAQK